NQDRRPVEDVELRVVQYVAEGVRGRAERCPQQMRLGMVRNARKQRLVPDHEETPWLLIDGARRLNRRVDQLVQHRFADRLVSEFAHGTPPVNGLQQLHGAPGSLGRDLSQARSWDGPAETIPLKQAARVD